MLCNICNKNEATVHLTQIVDNKMQKIDLCDTCSKSKGVEDPTGYSLANVLLGLGQEQESEPGQASEKKEQVSCPECGFTQADFKKTGRLGCSECYQYFSDVLGGLLKSMHKGPKHIGKVPKSYKESQDVSEHLKVLEQNLEKAISEENFEQAAVLRDEIKQTRDKLSQLTTQSCHEDS